MNTTVYFIRHAERLKVEVLNYQGSYQSKTEAEPLSVSGEEKAKRLSKIDDLNKLDLVVSSHYARTIATAKYIADRNQLNLYVDERFGEIKKRFKSWHEKLPDGFYVKLFDDENYRLGNSESLKEVCERTYDAFLELLNKNQGKRIALVFHGVAMGSLLKKWCNIQLDGRSSKITFNGELIFNDYITTPEIFKLVFNENNELIAINHIKVDYGG